MEGAGGHICPCFVFLVWRVFVFRRGNFEITRDILRDTSDCSPRDSVNRGLDRHIVSRIMFLVDAGFPWLLAAGSRCQRAHRRVRMICYPCRRM